MCGEGVCGFELPFYELGVEGELVVYNSDASSSAKRFVFMVTCNEKCQVACFVWQEIRKPVKIQKKKKKEAAHLMCLISNVPLDVSDI